MLNKTKLILKLKEFYFLEVYQVDLYSSESKTVSDIHLKRSFERKAEIEQLHVDYFSQKIKEWGGNVSQFSTSSFAAAGFLSGKAVHIMGIEDMYKYGIFTENTAIEMYKRFIAETGQVPELEELTRQLWYFMVDEEHHQYWFKEQLSQLHLMNV